jgi:hypothetical protein
MYMGIVTFGHNREEVAGGWKRLQNEELHNLYTSQNIIRVMKLRNEMSEACSTYGRKRNFIHFVE